MNLPPAGLHEPTLPEAALARLLGGSMTKLRWDAERCRDLEQQLAHYREMRDANALVLVENGRTWREVAEAAGFANPYIAALKRRAAASSVVSAAGQEDTG